MKRILSTIIDSALVAAVAGFTLFMLTGCAGVSLRQFSESLRTDNRKAPNEARNDN